MGIDNPVHLLFIAAVALLVLGPRRLPEVARSLGKGIREFREAMSEGSVGGFVHDLHDGVAGGVAPAPAPVPVQPAEGGVSPAGTPAPAPLGGEEIEDADVVVPLAAPAPPAQVDPGEPVRSGDHAPDRRPL
jgi:TatA/E family protein of Tat protein translocase